MAEKSRAERWVTNIAVITSTMAVIGGLYAAAVELHGPFDFPWARVTSSPSPVAATPAVHPTATAAAPAATAIPSTAPTSPRPPGRALAPTRFSNRVRLRDGEQSVILQGRLAVGISFTPIGSTTLATFRIVQEGKERSEPLIPLQRQFIVEVGGRKYSVATVAVDPGERTAVVQVDELGEGQRGRT